jgi:hypothetical protein
VLAPRRDCHHDRDARGDRPSRSPDEEGPESTSGRTRGSCLPTAPQQKRQYRGGRPPEPSTVAIVRNAPVMSSLSISATSHVHPPNGFPSHHVRDPATSACTRSWRGFGTARALVSIAAERSRPTTVAPISTRWRLSRACPHATSRIRVSRTGGSSCGCSAISPVHHKSTARTSQRTRRTSPMPEPPIEATDPVRQTMGAGPSRPAGPHPLVPPANRRERVSIDSTRSSTRSRLTALQRAAVGSGG